MVGDAKALAHGRVWPCDRRDYRQGGQAHGLFNVQLERSRAAQIYLMSEVRDWPRIAVVGAGAVGGYFGGILARAGAPTVFVGRKHFVDALNAQGLVLDNSEGQQRIAGTATTDMSAIRECSLILYC